MDPGEGGGPPIGDLRKRLDVSAATVRTVIQQPEPVKDVIGIDTLEKRIMGWRTDARNLSALVDEQLKHCRALRSDATVQHLVSLTQDSPEEALQKQCKNTLLVVKADIRALHDYDLSCMEKAKAAEAGDAGNTMDKERNRRIKEMEEVLQQVRVGSTEGVEFGTILRLIEKKQALGATILKSLIKEKQALDLEFGVASDEIQTEQNAADDGGAFGDAQSTEHCCNETRLFLQLCEQFKVLTHVVSSLLSVKSSAQHKLLRIVERLEGDNSRLNSELALGKKASEELQRNYDELINPELKTSLQSRQRMKLEEQEFTIRRITSQCEELQRENNRLLIENGRLTDLVSSLEVALAELKTRAEREMDYLGPRVQEMESRTESLAGLVEQLMLDMDLMTGLVRKYNVDMATLSEANSSQEEAHASNEQLQRQMQEHIDSLEKLLVKRDKISRVAMAARRQAQKQCADLSTKVDELNNEHQTSADELDSRRSQATNDRKMIANLTHEKLELEEKLAAMTARAESTQTSLDRRTSEFDALNRRFTAMFADGMTKERKVDFERLQLQLTEAMGDNSKQERKIQELEQKIFELELTIGMT